MMKVPLTRRMIEETTMMHGADIHRAQSSVSDLILSHHGVKSSHHSVISSYCSTAKAMFAGMASRHKLECVVVGRKSI